MAADDLLVVSFTVDGHQTEDPANGYQVDELVRGKYTLRRKTYDSYDVGGRLLVAWSAEQTVSTVSYWVTGASAAQVDDRLTVLKGWFAGVDYLVVIGLASTAVPGSPSSETYRCEPADWVQGDSGKEDPELLGNHYAHITFEWPHNPVRL
jgi:hypothetical protein